MNKGLIISGGRVNHDLLLSMSKNKYDYVVAVDGGMDYLWVIGLQPDVMIGDFDSCNAHALAVFRAQGVKEIEFDARKDKTDTDLAIEHMISKGIVHADMLGTTGSRLDHTLANMMLLFKYHSAIRLTAYDHHNKVCVAEPSMEIMSGAYKYISLVPISESVEGVCLKGVSYPLDHCTLLRESSYAISNEIVRRSCHLSFESGKLLLIQSRD